MNFSLGKNKKLKSHKSIEILFTQRKWVRKGALKAFYQPSSNGSNHKVGFSVSKRFFKKAPDRNRIKRLLREAYRLQQHELMDKNGTYLEIMFIYQTPKMQDITTINRWMKGVIQELNQVQIDP